MCGGKEDFQNFVCNQRRKENITHQEKIKIILLIGNYASQNTRFLHLQRTGQKIKTKWNCTSKEYILQKTKMK